MGNKAAPGHETPLTCTCALGAAEGDRTEPSSSVWKT